MKLKNRGKNTSKVEILNISEHGIWLYVQAKEYFLPYSEFPWFEQATVEQIRDVQSIHEHHLYWPGLDVDLEIESLNNLEKYLLLSH